MLSPFARYGFGLAVICAMAAPLSGIGYRFGWWPLGVAFGLLRWAAYGAIAATLVALVGAVATRPGTGRRGFALSLAAVLIGVATFGGPAMMLERAQKVPPIHDITTDTDNPPEFVAVLPLRAGAANAATYGGAEVATQQRVAYPRVVPLTLSVSPDVAFARALGEARAMGWDIVAAIPGQGRIEATDTTLLFGFKDDVVIRVTPAAGGSRVDVRSESRVGRSDIGTNARRVEAFLDRLAKASSAPAPKG
jgi:uncharacterized protein (DUF1499 family)